MFEAGAEEEGYKELGKAGIGERVVATPAIVKVGEDVRIYIRGKRHLYCIKEGGK